MTTIVAGLFDNISRAGAAVDALRINNCPKEDISVFHNNPPGQHDAFPIGGDEHADPGATNADSGAAAGAAIGAGVGLAAAAGPLGIAAAGVGAVGAYVGSLTGALSSSGEEGKGLTRRPAGVMVAVNTEGLPEQNISQILASHGAMSVERADGEWHNGEWVDFDPLSIPDLLSVNTNEGVHK